ncbi:nitrous oxide reductase family maturation protein NosD [bacterium]|nr:MAG: nitrous oxide reductase family maturation protein NosD [bacterium]
MKNCSTFLTFFLFICALGSKVHTKDLIVKPDGDIRSIKQALILSQNGDRIIVHAGRYAEGTITVDKSVTILGIGKPVIDGEGKGEIFTITAHGVIIEGLIIQNAGISYVQENAGIRLKDVQRCIIRNNELKMNFFAIYLAKSSDCLIENNHIRSAGTTESSSGNGIHLWSCRKITIKNNTITGHRDGIYFEFVKEGRIIGNVSEQNLRYGLHFMFSDSCMYTKNTFRDNSAGVAVMYTKSVTMVENTFEYNWGPSSYGILLKDISDSDIEKNLFIGNSTGLYIEGSIRLNIRKNDFIRNGWAVKLMANSYGNLFSENNFIGNSFDVATNSRSNFSTFEGNYWSAYSGYDLDRNGVGDIPFRPVSLFSFITQQQPASLILLRSFFVSILDVAEKMIPVLTPETLMDTKPMMRRIL